MMADQALRAHTGASFKDGIDVIPLAHEMRVRSRHALRCSESTPSKTRGLPPSGLGDVLFLIAYIDRVRDPKTFDPPSPGVVN